MSFNGTEHYREKLQEKSPFGKHFIHSFWCRESVTALCDRIDEQQKHIEQLKKHLDTYAEVIGKRQQENAGLRRRVETFEGALRQIADIHGFPYPDSLKQEEEGGA